MSFLKINKLNFRQEIHRKPVYLLSPHSSKNHLEGYNSIRHFSTQHQRRTFPSHNTSDRFSAALAFEGCGHLIKGGDTPNQGQIVIDVGWYHEKQYTTLMACIRCARQKDKLFQAKGLPPSPQKLGFTSLLNFLKQPVGG